MTDPCEYNQTLIALSSTSCGLGGNLSRLPACANLAPAIAGAVFAMSGAAAAQPGGETACGREARG
jgi:hypothetical protein